MGPLPLPARWLIFHIASGQAFFSGFALLAVAVVFSLLPRARFVPICRNASLIVGAALVVFSSTPLPGWCQFVLAVGFVAWMVGLCWPKRVPRRLELALAAGAIGASLVAVATEIPHHLSPSLPPLGRPTLGILGDSLTEGMGTSTIVTWPRLLAEARQIPIRDHARMGATVSSALEQAEQVGPDEDLVLLENGGNDLLGTTTPADFQAGLARLLSDLRRP